MVEQSNDEIARLVLDGALVLEYESMLTGKSSKLSRSQGLPLGHEEIPKVQQLPDGRAPQIHSIGGLEGQRVISTGGPSICLLGASTSGPAVVKLTSARIDSPERRIGNRKSPSNDHGADFVNPRTEGVSVSDLETAGERVCLQSTEVLMHILAIGESALHSESDGLCSHKAQSCVDNDRLEDLVTAADFASMGSFEVIMDGREVLEHRYIEVMLIDVRIRRQEPVVDRVRMKRVARPRTAGLQPLPFINENIPSKQDLPAPISSILVSAFGRGHVIFGSTQTLSEISGVLERIKVDVLLIGRMKMGNSSNFLIHIVVPDCKILGIAISEYMFVCPFLLCTLVLFLVCRLTCNILCNPNI